MADPSEQDIIQRESGGKPYVGWSGVDLSSAPLDENGFPIWKGAAGPQGWSHAAGLYQFQPGTWATYAKPLGVKDFSPESQKKVYDAARAAEGGKPWQASAGTRDYVDPEGLQHVAIHPAKPDEATPDALLAMLMAGPVKVPEQATPSDHPDQLLDSLLAGTLGGQQQQGSVSGPSQQPFPQPSTVAPAAGPENVVAGASVPTNPIVPTNGGQPPAPLPLVPTNGGTAAAPSSISRVLDATLAGVALGGILVLRIGIFRSLLLCGGLQALSNLMYAAQVWAGHDVAMLSITIGGENLTGGMASAAFVAYLSGLCNRDFTATQYALLSSLATFGLNVLAATGGWLAERLGWTPFFVLSTLACVPALLLLTWLMRRAPAPA